MPAVNLVDRVQLIGRRAPQSAIVGPENQYPAHGKCQHGFSETLLRDLSQRLDHGKILAEAFTAEFRIDFAQIVAFEFCLGGHSSA